MKKNPLAYARVIDKIRLPEAYHKGKKIMDNERQKIRKLYQSGGYSYRTLAEMYSVSYTTIQCIINEQARLNNLKRSIEWRKNNKKKPTDCMELRKRKKKLIQSGIIKLNQ